jgi:uncharacterized membrane protein YgaE (UPF0421/DUF939 family)
MARPTPRTELLRARARLRGRMWPVVQTAAAAAAAWYAALLLLPAAQPLFAPIAAVIALGAATGSSGRRAFELVGGVILGILVADLIVHVIGTGPWQAAVMVVLAMGTAIAVGGGETLVAESAVSAILLATLQPAASGFPPERFLEALVGGGTALVIGVMLFPPNPALEVGRAINDVFAALGQALGRIAAALEAGDESAAADALTESRALDGRVDAVRRELAELRDTARIAPLRRRSRAQLARIERSLPHVDYAVRDTRVLARNVQRHVRGGHATPPALVEALNDLTVAVWELAAAYDDTRRDETVREVALAAAGRATELAEDARDLRLTEIGVQVRSLAVDLVRAAELASHELDALVDRPTEEMLSV